MEENKTPEENETKGAPIPVWLRLMIVVNIFLLAGVLAWWVKDQKSYATEDMVVDMKEQSKTMEAMLDANPPPREDAAPSYEPVIYVINATAKDKWVHFSFLKNSVFTDDRIAVDSTEWDIVFRRAKILSNGGATGKAGKAEVAVIPQAKFETVVKAPTEGYFKDLPTENIAENMNPALDKWYIYDFWTHKLRPKFYLYVMKTTPGDMVKFQLVDYYCGKVSGCFTIKYQFLKPSE